VSDHMGKAFQDDEARSAFDEHPGAAHRPASSATPSQRRTRRHRLRVFGQRCDVSLAPRSDKPFGGPLSASGESARSLSLRRRRSRKAPPPRRDRDRSIHAVHTERALSIVVIPHDQDYGPSRVWPRYARAEWFVSLFHADANAVQGEGLSDVGRVDVVVVAHAQDPHPARDRARSACCRRSRSRSIAMNRSTERRAPGGIMIGSTVARVCRRDVRGRRSAGASGSRVARSTSDACGQCSRAWTEIWGP